MDEAFALPPTPRRDLAQAYDDAIAVVQRPHAGRE